MDLFQEAITVVEHLAEDASGVAATRETSHRAYVEFLSAEARTYAGNTSVNASFIAIDPAGWSVSWSLKPGDIVSAREIALSVLSVNAVVHPFAPGVHHVEVSCG